MFKKQSFYSKGNESNNYIDKNKGQVPKTKMYRGNKTQTETKGPDLESDTNFKGQCRNLEGHNFNLGQEPWTIYKEWWRSLNGILEKPT